MEKSLLLRVLRRDRMSPDYTGFKSEIYEVEVLPLCQYGNSG
jgi:hypothetical protein